MSGADQNNLRQRYKQHVETASEDGVRGGIKALTNEGTDAETLDRRLLLLAKLLGETHQEMESVVPAIHEASTEALNPVMDALVDKASKTGETILQIQRDAATEGAEEIRRERRKTLQAYAEAQTEIKQLVERLTDAVRELKAEKTEQIRVRQATEKTVTAVGAATKRLEGQARDLQESVSKVTAAADRVETVATQIEKASLRRGLEAMRSEASKFQAAVEKEIKRLIEVVRKDVTDEVEAVINKIAQQRLIVSKQNRDEKRRMQQRVEMYETMKGKMDELLERETKLINLAKGISVRQSVLIASGALVGSIVGVILTALVM